MTPDDFRALLNAAGLSQGDAAKLLGVQRRTINRWATGATNIDARNAHYIRSLIKPKRRK